MQPVADQNAASGARIEQVAPLERSWNGGRESQVR